MKNRTRLKNKPDVVEALKLLAAKYDVENAPSIEEARKILDKASRKYGKTLSQTVVEMREEDR